MTRTASIEANINTIKVLKKMALDKAAHREKIIAKIKNKANN